MYYLVVCNGTNNYVNHFWANIWKFLENVEIRMNSFQFPMCQHATNQKMEKVQVAIDGEISTVDFYLSMGHTFLFKGHEFPAIYEAKRMKGMLC